ncbi:MAG TPA: potassium-transporting ATPase subunit KdpC [Thermoanaerobaculia bacterium]|nr:potassium-transporting ATPase subunit KdpC [Thermoanaerobaculia bacterium]
MKDHAFVSIRLLVVFTVLLGLAYPAIVWAIGRVAFPRRASGSFVTHDGKVVGSELIGQAARSPGLFRPRPSAAGSGYDAAASGGSNLGPTSKALPERVAAEAGTARAQNPGAQGPIPADAVTASGSGLDPHVSPEFALWQVPRVSRESGFPAAELEALVARRTEGRFLGLFGEPRVNVLLLNLDVLSRRPPPAGGGPPPR